MKILEAEIQNFLSIGEARISFGGTGLTRIVGINNDSPSSESNGAGKSSIFESIFWCLYGQTKRGLRGSDVVNRYAGKNPLCSVCVRLLAGGKSYLIERMRNHPEHGSALFFYGTDGDGPTDLTKGTTAETQKAILDVIKCSSLTFSKSAYFGQEDVLPFASLKDRQLKEVFEQSLGVEIIQAHSLKANAHHSALLDEHNKIEAELVVLEGRVKSEKEALRIAQKAMDEWGALHDDEIKVCVDSIEKAKAKIKTYLAENAEFEKIKGEYEKIAVELALRVNKLIKLQVPLDEKIGRVTEVRGEFIGHKKHEAKLIDELDDLIETSKSKIGKPCSECGKIYDSSDIDPYVEKLSGKKTKAVVTHKQYDAGVSKVDAKIEELRGLRDGLKAKIDAISAEISDAKHGASGCETRKNSNLSAMAIDEKDLSDSQARLKRLEVMENPNKEEVDAISDRIVRLGAQIDLLGEKHAEKEAEIEIASYLVGVLGNGGLKNYIFSGITPELNKIANEYLATLDDIEVDISTVKKLKSGELRDKFDVKVNNRHGAAIFEGNSGGEKQKVNLAIALAFNRVIRGMSAEAPNVLFLDEPFESLDPGSSEKVAELCESLLVDNDIFVITHNENIKGLITNTITVEKKDGMATIK